MGQRGYKICLVTQLKSDRAGFNTDTSEVLSRNSILPEKCGFSLKPTGTPGEEIMTKGG